MKKMINGYVRSVYGKVNWEIIKYMIERIVKK